MQIEYDLGIKWAYQRFTYTREFIADFGLDMFMLMCKTEFRAAGYEPVCHYFTFYYDDYASRQVCLVMLDHIPEYMLLTASVELQDQALKEAAEMNSHMTFTNTETGHLLEGDFVQNRRTAKIFLTLKRLP